MTYKYIAMALLMAFQAIYKAFLFKSDYMSILSYLTKCSSEMSTLVLIFF